MLVVVEWGWEREGEVLWVQNDLKRKAQGAGHCGSISRLINNGKPIQYEKSREKEGWRLTTSRSQPCRHVARFGPSTPEKKKNEATHEKKKRKK